MTDRGTALCLVQMRLAVLCIAVAVLGGMVAALHYVPDLSLRLNELGLTLPKLRPIHTTFASVWIFGGGIAVVYHYLATTGGLTRGDVRRFWFHTACWLTAGAGILVTLLLGVFSGREYLGFHPAFSILLIAGWLAFAFSFLRRLRAGFFAQPVYVWFWTIGICFFVYTFAEGHAWLLPSIGEQPVRDLQIQWKSCGTLVGSFNFLVYGALIYVSERLSGDRRYGQSRLAFALFGVGCLNSFTNYAHHTYHLPQTHAVKWIAFVVSMTEIVILLRLLWDLRKLVQRRGAAAVAAARYLNAARFWTAAMLFGSLLISVPPLNALIHGTHVVTGHAMGTELGIDTMVLLGAAAFLVYDVHGRPAWLEDAFGSRALQRNFTLLNVAMAALVGWLTLAGTVHGVNRYLGEPTPSWVGLGRYVFPVTGAILGVTLLELVRRWMPLLLASPVPVGAPEDAETAAVAAPVETRR